MLSFDGVMEGKGIDGSHQEKTGSRSLDGRCKRSGCHDQVIDRVIIVPRALRGDDIINLDYHSIFRFASFLDTFLVLKCVIDIHVATILRVFDRISYQISYFGIRRILFYYFPFSEKKILKKKKKKKNSLQAVVAV